MQPGILLINEKVFLDEDMELVYKALNKKFADVSLITESDHEKILTLFETKYKDIDILIIDHHMSMGVALLNTLLQRHRKLKTITLSGSPYCSDPMNCTHCQETFNKKRMLKPISKYALFETIEAFEDKECEYKDDCDDPHKAGFLL
ncbi:MAG: hypothetical protein ACQERK_06960 [Campylobacterota bacterium]